MHLILLLLSSLFLGFVSYYDVIRMDTELRKSFVLLLTYRYAFFILQSIVFYTVYYNQLDSFFYHETLAQLVDTFNRYPLDMVQFFRGNYKAIHISEELKQYFVKEVRATFFMKVLSPFYLLSANNYYVFGAWLTFFGSLCFAPFLSLFKRSNDLLLWLIVLLIPSFTFWTVGIVKEAFVIPVLFLLYSYLNKIIESKGKDIVSILLFVLFCFLAWQVKYYLVALFLFTIIIYFLNSKIPYSFNAVLFSIFVLATCVIGLGFMHPALQWNVLPEVIYISNTLTCTKYVDAYVCIPFDLDMSWTSILINYPKAMLYAFFSPFPWQIHNATSLLAAIENYLFIGLFFVFIYKWFSKKSVVSNVELIGLFLILLIGALLIMASPNIGSFSRYRIFYLPIYAYILIRHSGIAYTDLFLRVKNWMEK
jgi:hypothetical protein